MHGRNWTTGELARETGLTVRALRHYDRLGLLTPAERSEAGYRIYGEPQVRRLQQIVALRDVGMSLEQIASALASDAGDVRTALHAQLRNVQERQRAAATLSRRLRTILAALDSGAVPSLETVMDAIKETKKMEQYYTEEQLHTLEGRARELGPEGLERAQREWAETIAAMEAARRGGDDPTTPHVQALAARWRALIAGFTGGDDGIRSGLQRRYREQGAEQSSHGMVSEELMAYVRRALAAADSA